MQILRSTTANLIFGLALCSLLLARSSLAQEGAILEKNPPTTSEARIKLDPPGPREFILDKADIISAEDEKQIRALADKLLTDKAAPLVVVTINSMADHGGAGMRIETFAHFLFDQWEIGPANFQGKSWNYGILLLVSQNDRKARIELGKGWGLEKDAVCQQIMAEQIIPFFKQDKYSEGIVAGSQALEKMARGLELPKPATPPAPWWAPWVMAGLVVLAIGTIISLIRSGSSGWAWLGWGLALGLVGTIIYQLLNNNNHSSGGSSGGYSGGSFGGGGFSGGGGATGSW